MNVRFALPQYSCDDTIAELLQYAKDKWEEFCKAKLGIKGYFNINIESIKIA